MDTDKWSQAHWKDTRNLKQYRFISIRILKTTGGQLFFTCMGPHIDIGQLMDPVRNTSG